MKYITLDDDEGEHEAGGGGDRHRHQNSITAVQGLRHNGKRRTSIRVILQKKFYGKNFATMQIFFLKENFSVYVYSEGMTVFATTDDHNHAGVGVVISDDLFCAPFHVRVFRFGDSSLMRFRYSNPTPTPSHSLGRGYHRFVTELTEHRYMSIRLYPLRP